ncbi:MAG: PTS fructose transporter subunit IIA [Xanthomonadales bacterium]|nr:PTS fructose transporter subunit IIA [Gammaproteobacteria bacterium]MBT8053065.1 PTS fructose transporter subunit IIA [Gammaproteobacteria bacterium]NND56691.1 PTS fructose transporter subunit IIA [Xanthomonadales bacterium]NNK52676.1 PTS fructose transporter subunit IIA [Xanthomonadales bacterium]
MSVGLVIVTHGSTGESLIEEAGFVLGQLPEEIFTVAFNHATDMEGSLQLVRSCMEQADSGEGVLVLTDLIGASPSNLVGEMLEDYHAVMVTGANLSMLICACNYRGKPLEMMVRKVVESGKRSVKIFQK